MITRIDQARPAVVYALLVLLLAAVFVPMSCFRLVDGDEGTYILDARLVMEGQLLFHDLFWPQMFLTPYIFGVWMKIFGNSWYAARFLAALASIALGLLLFRQVRHLTGRAAWGVLAVVLYAFSSLEFGWLPLVKTFPFVTLTLFGAYAVLTQSRSPYRWFYSGVLLGLAIDIRLYVIVVVPAFLVELYLDERHDFRKRVMQVARFTVGLVLALLPNQFFYLIDPETFMFNIIGVHAIRSPWGFLGLVRQKVDTALSLLALIDGPERVLRVQFAALFFLSAALWITRARARRRPALSSTIFVLLAVVSLLPTPTDYQYFSITVPFLVVDAVVFVAALAAAGPRPWLRRLVTAGVAAYVLVAPFDMYRFTLGGAALPGIFVHDEAETWRLSTVQATARAIDEEILPGRPLVISVWPGYFLDTKARILPKMENHFTLGFSLDMTKKDIAKFHFMSYPELLWNLELHSVDVVVLGNVVFRNSQEFRGFLRGAVERNGYVLVRRIAGNEIYKLPEARR